MLFNIYVNEIFNIPITGHIISFADDTALFYKDKSWLSLKKIIQQEFPILLDFLASKLLTINIKKTKYLPFTSYVNNLPHYNNITLNYNDVDIELESAKTIKYLGIVIDSHLKWDTHVSNIVRKLRGLIPKFKYFRKIFDISHLKTMYYALVQTHLQYGVLIWGGVLNCHLKQLEVMQRWILKVIFNKPYLFSSNDLYLGTGILDIRQLFCQTLILYQKNHICKNQIVDHSYNTRFKSNSIAIPKMEKTIGQKSFTFLSPKVYNAIPNHLKEVNSIKLFKRKLSEWIIATPRTVIHRLI